MRRGGEEKREGGEGREGCYPSDGTWPTTRDTVKPRASEKFLEGSLIEKL